MSKKWCLTVTLLGQSRVPQKSFLLLLEEKEIARQIKKCEENFFVKQRAKRAIAGRSELVGILFKISSDFSNKHNIMNFLKHIAIIPDGNRRWAKEKGLQSFLGYNKGAETAEKIIKEAISLKILYLTIWGCSINNIIKRPKTEISFLFKIFEQQFKKLSENNDIYKNKVKINVFGRWKELFPEKLAAIVEKAIKKTKNHDSYQLTFLLGYSGIDEITSAIQKIAEIKAKNSKFQINAKSIKNNLWTKDLPPIDLVIRTGGEPHLSDGFMMWDVADAHFNFTKTFWPDFSIEEFKDILADFGKIERRLGK